LTIAPLSGPLAVSTFCNGYPCDERTGLCVLTTATGDIVGDTTWSGDMLLTGQVFVQPGATLTILPGVVVSSIAEDAEGLAPAVVVLPGGTLVAEGTAEAPITFTAAAEERSRGLWGGLIIMGNAPVSGGTQEVEGLSGYTYGGSNATESSGSLRYVRVWYGGAVVGEDNEINGITFAGVGSATTVDHVEVAFNLDDGFEMFGGTVNLKYISALFCGDDAIDTDLGYQGKIQFAFVVVGRAGLHALEMDSTIDGTPRSFPQLYSATLVHHRSPATVAATVNLREGTGGEFANLIVTNAPDVAVHQDSCDAETRTHVKPAAGAPDYLWFSSKNIVFGSANLTAFDLDASCAGLTTANNADPSLWFMPEDADETSLGYDPRPRPASPALADADDVPDDTFFEPVDYIGAFAADSTWLSDWSWLDEAGLLVKQVF